MTDSHDHIAADQPDTAAAAVPEPEPEVASAAASAAVQKPAARKSTARKTAAKRAATTPTAAKQTATKRPATRAAAGSATKAPAATPPTDATPVAEATVDAEAAAPAPADTAAPKLAPARATRATAKTAAPKAPATETPAKKTTAKKTPARKTPAKKTPAKKTTAKETTAKRTAASATEATAAPADAAAPAEAPAPAATPQPLAARDREYDIVVYGATGFVGRLVAEYLAQNAPAELRIALAGRSHAKLFEIRSGIPAAADWPLITADSSDPDSVNAMAARTRVLITTVGPYLSYGLPVVAACAEHGTHYVDLTGEVLFMRRSIEEYDAVARASGARIIHSCGFDSIPSDLGVLALHQVALRDSDGSLGDTKLGVVRLRGGLSGGTIASMFTELGAAGADPSLRAVAADPYSLSPDRESEPSPGDGDGLSSAGFDNDLDSWFSPFIMAMVNTRVVRRSNALLGYAYSKDFRYQEVFANGTGPQGMARAMTITGGMAAGMAALSFGPARALAKRILPKPGDGPDENARRNGSFAIRLVSRTADGRTYRGTVAAQGDPGYAATAMMISQCALTLVLDQDKLPKRAGVLTPASGLGQAAIDRLTGAGMTIEAHRA